VRPGSASTSRARLPRMTPDVDELVIELNKFKALSDQADKLIVVPGYYGPTLMTRQEAYEYNQETWDLIQQSRQWHLNNGHPKARSLNARNGVIPSRAQVDACIEAGHQITISRAGRRVCHPCTSRRSKENAAKRLGAK